MTVTDIPLMELDGQGGDFPFPLNPDLMISWPVAMVEFLLNIIIAVTFFSLFVAFFFFTIASRIELSTVEANTSRVVKELVSTLVASSTPESKALIASSIDGLQTPDLSSEDKVVQDSNDKLVKNTWLFLGSAFACGVVLVLGVWGGMKMYAGKDGKAGIHYPNLRHLVIDNLILLSFVAATEFLFLLAIGAHYRSVDTNKLRLSAVDSMLSFTSH